MSNRKKYVIKKDQLYILEFEMNTNNLICTSKPFKS